jgi:hypothetical protein
MFILFICYREEKKEILDEFLKSEDFKEGIQFFLERRDADFKGGFKFYREEAFPRDFSHQGEPSVCPCVWAYRAMVSPTIGVAMGIWFDRAAWASRCMGSYQGCRARLKVPQ